MTDPASVEAIYASVIEDTIFKLSPEFENAGVPMIVLSRLQEVRIVKSATEMYMMRFFVCGISCSPLGPQRGLRMDHVGNIK